ncbi:MAG: hypothetical protein HGB22_08075 [Chlorobiaceae bacterium]|nr:hypothetical protein [Chlorobiaceae bacterium]
MSREERLAEIQQYILDTKYALLTYVRSDLSPITRTMGSFAPDGLNIFFSTGKATSKVKEIEKNRRASFFFEHDNQLPEQWKSLLLVGEAEALSAGSSDYDKAVERLAAKSPRFRQRVENGELDSAAIYRINTSELEYVDRSTSNSPTRINIAR